MKQIMVRLGDDDEEMFTRVKKCIEQDKNVKLPDGEVFRSLLREAAKKQELTTISEEAISDPA